MQNRHISLSVILFLFFIPLYNYSMDKESLWNNATHKSPIDAIFARDIEPALIFLREHPEEVHKKHPIFYHKTRDKNKQCIESTRKMSPLEAAFFAYSEPILHQIFSTKQPTKTELHDLLSNAAIIYDIFSSDPTHIYQSTIYLIKKWNASVRKPCTMPLPFAHETILNGSLFSVYFCRLVFMDPNELVNFPVSLGDRVIKCLLKKAHKNLPTKRFIQFTRINRSNCFIPFENSDDTISPYEILFMRYAGAYYHEQEGKMKKELRMNLFSSLFKICLPHISFEDETYSLLKKYQKDIPPLAGWIQYYKDYQKRLTNK